MAKNTKALIGFYPAWSYAEEAEKLDRRSAQGWQVRKIGCFVSKLERNENLRYIHQFDYQPKLENFGRYLETYREQGWEFVNRTFNGWYLFRKLYDPMLPREAYEVYTDRESLDAMKMRWRGSTLAIVILLGISVAINTALLFFRFTLPKLALTLGASAEFVTILRGYLLMRSPEADRRISRERLRFLIMAVVLFACLALNFSLDSARPDFKTEIFTMDHAPIAAKPENGTEIGAFRIKYTDRYYLNLNLRASAPITLSICNADGNAVYVHTDREFVSDDETLRLTPGEYKLMLSDYAGGELKIEAALN